MHDIYIYISLSLYIYIERESERFIYIHNIYICSYMRIYATKRTTPRLGGLHPHGARCSPTAAEGHEMAQPSYARPSKESTNTALEESFGRNSRCSMAYY